MFGKKGLQAAPPAAPQDGYAWVDAHLSRYAQAGSLGFSQSLGLKLFDSAYNAMKSERGVRIEDIVAMLSSVAGQLCLFAVLEALREERRQPRDIGMVTILGNDGRTYHFGDAPNRLLCEAEHSFVSLVFGAAHQHGAKVDLDMVHAEMKTVAGRVGHADFLELDLPTTHSVDSPFNWVRIFTEFVIKATSEHFRKAVANMPMPIPPKTEAPSLLMPRIVGFAVQQAIDVGHKSLDPTILAQIALACSLRTAKLDPRVFAGTLGSVPVGSRT